MKFAIQDGLFPPQPADKLFAKIAGWGFDAVEVMGEGLDKKLGEIKSASQKSGLPVCAVCPGLHGIRGSLLSDNSEELSRARADILILLHCCADLGGAGLNIVPEFGAAKFMRLLPDSDDFIKRKKRFAAELAPLAEEAKKLGAPILLEPLNRYEAYFLLTVAQGAELCAELDNPAVGVLADLFHMNIEDTIIPAAFEDNAKYIFHVHAADSNRKLPGLGHTDFKSTFAALKNINYSGFVSMECGITGDPSKEVPTALAFLKNSV